MAAPTLQAQGATATGVTTGVPSITIPTHQADDILVVDLMFWGPNTLTSMSDIPTPSGGWAAMGAQITAAGSPPDGKIARFWLRASGAGTTVTATRGSGWDTGTDTCYNGRAYVIRGCITTGDPWDAVTNAGPYTAANQNLPAITVSGTERLAIVFGASGDNLAFAMNGSGYTAGTEDADNGGTDSSFQTTRQDNVSGNISATASVVTATATGPYGFIGVSFKPPVPPENHDASPTATAGGVVVAAGRKGAQFAGALTGGGVTVQAATGAHAAVVPATGAGVVAVGRLVDRQVALVATGGGVLVEDYVASSSENHDATFTATGAGVATLSETTARNLATASTGSGVLAASASSARSVSLASSGAGAATLAEALGQTVSVTATGGGAVSPSVVAARYGAMLLSGGGVLTEAQATARYAAFTSTGGGVTVVDGTSETVQPSASPHLTGSGVAVVASVVGLTSSPAMTGSGSVSIAVVTGHAPSITATGGGAAVMARLGEHYADLAGTGGGVVGIAGAQPPPILPPAIRASITATGYLSGIITTAPRGTITSGQGGGGIG
jgi:hypothetical protein